MQFLKDLNDLNGISINLKVQCSLSEICFKVSFGIKTKREGNDFTGTCDSVHGEGNGGGVGYLLLWSYLRESRYVLSWSCLGGGREGGRVFPILHSFGRGGRYVLSFTGAACRVLPIQVLPGRKERQCHVSGH